MLHSILACIVEVEDTEKRVPLIGMCRTRWSERHTADSHFYTSYIYIVKALEVIALKMHADEYCGGIDSLDCLWQY